MINLFSHNQIACGSAVEMLSEIGKAAIIRSTGAGRSACFARSDRKRFGLASACEQRKAYNKGKFTQGKILKLAAKGVIALPTISIQNKRTEVARV